MYSKASALFLFLEFVTIFFPILFYSLNLELNLGLTFSLETSEMTSFLLLPPWDFLSLPIVVPLLSYAVEGE